MVRIKPPGDPIEFGKRLRSLRLERGWSQEDLARLVGVARHTIYLYERGGSLPTKTNMRKLVDILGVRPEALGIPPEYLARHPATDKTLNHPVGQAIMKYYGLSPKSVAYLVAFLDSLIEESKEPDEAGPVNCSTFVRD